MLPEPFDEVEEMPVFPETVESAPSKRAVTCCSTRRAAATGQDTENPAQRTGYTHVGFRASDGLLVAAGVAVVVAALACSRLGVGK